MSGQFNPGVRHVQHNPVSPGAPRESLVETTQGKVRGRFENGVHVFKGLRYGETTGGRSRFLPPQPVKPWAGIADATAWGSSAPQNPVREHTDPFYSWYAAIQPVSEDCLFLNVFTPAIDSVRRPVLFWIYGGGWREFREPRPGSTERIWRASRMSWLSLSITASPHSAIS